MNILVTGCYGFVGHGVVKALLARGHKVIGTDRLNGAVSYKAHRVKESKGLHYIEASLADYEQAAGIFASHKIDVVFHLAAQFPVKHELKTVGQFIDSNVKGLLNVCEAARLHGTKRIIYSSSIVARTSGRPSSLYGATKHFGEEAMHVYSRLGMEIVVLRLGAVYGPMMRTDAGLWKVANMVLAGRRLPMMTGFGSKHEMVFIDDLADCMAAFAAADLPARYILETLCAEDYAADFGDAAAIIGRTAGIKPIFPQGYSQAPRERMCDMAPVRKIIGMAPATTLDNGLARLVESIR